MHDDAAGRILGKQEYLEALKRRPEIFRRDRDCLLAICEAVSLSLGLLLGLWLSTRQPQETDSDFLLRLPYTRPVRLASLPPANTLPDRPDADPATVLHGIPPEIRQPGNSPQTNDKTDPATPAAAVGATRIEKYKPEVDPAVSPPDLKPEERISGLAGYRRALEKNPRDPLALAGIGTHHYRAGSLDSAVAYLIRSLNEDPDNPRAFNDLGSAQYYRSTMVHNGNFSRRRGHEDPSRFRTLLYDSAVAAYTSAFSLDSGLVEALANRGVVHANFSRLDKALHDYSLALQLDATHADAYVKRADLYKRSGDHQLALDDYTAAISLDSSHYRYDRTLRFANAYYGRGESRYRSGDFPGALADFDSVLIIFPRHARGALYKGMTLGRLNRYEQAIGYLGRAIAVLSPREYGGARMVGHMHRGNAYKALGKLDSARVDYNRARELPRLSARAAWRIAQCHSLQGNPDSALVWLEKSAEAGFTQFHLWRTDPDLAPLWSGRDYKTFIDGLRHYRKAIPDSNTNSEEFTRIGDGVEQASVEMVFLN